MFAVKRLWLSRSSPSISDFSEVAFKEVIPLEAESETEKNGLSFEEIHEKFNRQIQTWVRMRVRNEEHSEEIVQEVLIRLFHTYKRYDPSRPLAAWLKILTKNVVIDWFRKQQSSGGAEIPHSFHEEESVFAQAASREPLPDARLLLKSDRRILFRAMRKLTELQKRVVWLRLIRALSYQEISQDLGISLDSVKGAMYRAKQILNQNEELFA